MQIKYLKYLNVLEFLGLTTNKGKTMGLDQYANVRDKQSGQMKSPDFDKVYSDKGRIQANGSWFRLEKAFTSSTIHV